MGVAYSKEAQDHLEAAYDHLYVAKKIVYSKLFPEPENSHDNKAIIAVSIKYNDDWLKLVILLPRLDFRRSLVSGLPSPRSEERGWEAQAPFPNSGW